VAVNPHGSACGTVVLVEVVEVDVVDDVDVVEDVEVVDDVDVLDVEVVLVEVVDDVEVDVVVGRRLGLPNLNRIASQRAVPAAGAPHTRCATPPGAGR